MMNFWNLMDRENPKCDVCGTILIQIDDGVYYCQECEEELSLCGSYGVCEGIAHNGPYVLQNGELVRKNKSGDGYGFCDMCGNGWEWA